MAVEGATTAFGVRKVGWSVPPHKPPEAGRRDACAPSTAGGLAGAYQPYRIYRVRSRFLTTSASCCFT